LAISGAIIALFVWRTVMEDRMLRRELPGYAEYAVRTRYRLVPGLW
jgi:protein-S-isoprenylcysteine O-methyltransferase Ste14